MAKKRRCLKRASAKQKAQWKRFAAASRKCAGQGKGARKVCMKKALKK